MVTLILQGCSQRTELMSTKKDGYVRGINCICYRVKSESESKSLNFI